ncbi:MAG: hypothetical protein WAO71_05840 [Gallionella sp.]
MGYTAAFCKTIQIRMLAAEFTTSCRLHSRCHHRISASVIWLRSVR